MPSATFQSYGIISPAMLKSKLVESSESFRSLASVEQVPIGNSRMEHWQLDFDREMSSSLCYNPVGFQNNPQ